MLCLICLPGCSEGSSTAMGASGQAITKAGGIAEHEIVTATDFLSRSGFAGFAFINDRAIAGDFVVFQARPALVPQDTNGVRDVYAVNTTTGAIIPVSVSDSGAFGDGVSGQASISANGRYIVFQSSATNLVAGDTNGADDIFLHDLQLAKTTRISVDSGGADANGDSLTPVVSNNGEYVAFASDATDLVVSDGNGFRDIFLRDVAAGTTTLLSSDSGGGDSDGPSFDPAITPDGSFICFSTEATDLIVAGLNGQRQIIRQERASGTRALVSQNGGAQSDASCYEPSVSDDGNLVAFFTLATNLGTDTNGLFDVYLRNISGNTTSLVSVDMSAGEANGHSGYASVSGDGTAIAFGSLATDLISGDSNGRIDVFSRSGGSTARVSVNGGNVEGDIDSDLTAISATGRYVVFRSAATNLDPADTSSDDDIFLRDTLSGTTTLLTKNYTPSLWDTLVWDAGLWN